MKTTFKLGLIILSFVSSGLMAQQESFSISTQLRSRGEVRNGNINPHEDLDNPAMFINNRARLTMDYARPNLEVRFSTQHVNVWGEDPQIDRNGRLMLNEAWAKLKKDDFSFQFGRQPLSYDDERILGGLDWNASGRFHDALKIVHQKGEHAAHLVLAYNQNSESFKETFYIGGGQPYKTMQTLWYHYGKANTTPFNISLLAVNLGLQKGTLADYATNYMQTFGTFVTYKEKSWDLSGTYYHQTGKNTNDDKINAFMGGISAKYAFNSLFALSVGTEYLSGNKKGETTINAFNPLYGTHHKFYGTMDYFFASGFKPGFNPGLIDNQIGFYYKTSNKVDMSLNYHYFLVAEEVYKANNDLISKNLGSEVDLQLNWSIAPDVKLMGGYSFMVGTPTMELIKGGSFKNNWQDWGWISINISPRVFTSKW